MTTENILTRINAIVAQIDDGAITHAAKFELSKLIADLQEQVRLDCAKSKGSGNALRTITRMLNGVSDSRIALKYAHIDAKGRQCCMDGFRAFRLNEHLPLPERPEDAGDPIDFDKIFPESTSDYDAIPFPSVKDLRTHLALQRTQGHRNGVMWDFGEGRPIVNVQYLIDLRTVFPDADKIFCLRGSRGVLAPMYVKTEKGDGLVMPCRHDDCRKRMESAARQESFRKMMQAYNDAIKRKASYAMSPEEFVELAAVAV